jgi:Fe-S cluster assembly protein SufD
MSAALQQTAEGFSARYQALASELPGPREPRRRAAALFRARGLPDARNEAWRYTSLRPLAGVVFSRAQEPNDAAPALLARAPAIEGPLLVFANGRLRADLSRLPQGAQHGVNVASFATDPSFGSLPGPDAEPLVTLNTMLAEDGAAITVPADTDGGTLVLLHLGSGETGRPPGFHPRHHIHLGRGARLALLEIALGEGTYLHNPVMEVALAEAANLLHLRLQNESPRAFHLASLHAVLAARSHYEAFTLVRGARLARSEIHADIEGQGALLTLNAAQVLDGEQHADITTVVRHNAPGSASRQTVKNVLTERAHGVFQGRIAVARIAQKTDGYQMNQALLLSDEAEVNSKPELEIFADDVKCSHGATVGALDPDQLFYLRSRGVPREDARAILVRAFLAETLGAIPHDRGRAVLEGAVDSWWKDRPL